MVPLNRVQYVSQKAVKLDDVRDLTDAEQDRFIKEVAAAMERDMRAQVLDARPVSDLGFWVTGPHDVPVLGHVHVHHLAAWFDLDTMPAGAPFRLAAIKPDADPDKPV